MKPVYTLYACLQALFLCAALVTGTMATAAEQPVADEAAQQQVDINTADAATLAAILDGIGMVKAQAIVEYREQFGNFRAVEQLLEVRGIGTATLEQNRHRITVSMPGANRPSPR